MINYLSIDDSFRLSRLAVLLAGRPGARESRVDPALLDAPRERGR